MTPEESIEGIKNLLSQLVDTNIQMMQALLDIKENQVAIKAKLNTLPIPIRAKGDQSPIVKTPK